MKERWAEKMKDDETFDIERQVVCPASSVRQLGSEAGGGNFGMVQLPLQERLLDELGGKAGLIEWNGGRALQAIEVQHVGSLQRARDPLEEGEGRRRLEGDLLPAIVAQALGHGGQGGVGKHVVYHAESGRSAYYRWKLHEAAVEDGDLDNAFAKHTAIFHQDKAGDPSIYKMACVKTFPKSLERQVSEGQAITDSAGAAAGLGGGGGQKADYLMNSRAEYRLPAVQRVTLTRQVRERASGS